MKDHFSAIADNYASFRPVYPDTLFEFILMHCNNRIRAWDCGTGNGQVAIELCKYFQQVYATDISQNQINHAYKHEKIIYNVEPVERCSSQDNSFDLIIAAQSAHWFDLGEFYKQVYRTAVSNCLISIVGYSLIQIDQDVDPIISELYFGLLGPHWDPERKHIDEQYRSIPFPFKEIKCPEFHIELEWSIDLLIGYLQTWSAVFQYEKIHHLNPVQLIHQKLKEAWGAEVKKKIRFPVFMRGGHVQKN